MFILYAEKNRLCVRKKELLTSGSVNVCTVRFEFSPDWDGLTKTAVFRAGGVSRSQVLNGECEIPWEVLEKPGLHLQAGICGILDEDTVLPTVWADLGVIQEGAAVGEAGRPPTPELWQQMQEALSGKADSLLLDGMELQLLAEGFPLSSVLLPEGSGASGVSDHRLLSGRSAADQHPIEAVSGLAEALEAIPRSMTADELRKILTGGQ